LPRTRPASAVIHCADTLQAVRGTGNLSDSHPRRGVKIGGVADAQLLSHTTSHFVSSSPGPFKIGQDVLDRSYGFKEYGRIFSRVGGGCLSRGHGLLSPCCSIVQCGGIGCIEEVGRHLGRDAGSYGDYLIC
jgi:hypothetical protein